MKKLTILLFSLLFLFSCTPSKRIYKIKFDDGTIEYYSLPYKIKEGSKYIEYRGETIFGVESFEEIK